MAWDEALERLELLGAVPGRSETAAEFAGRAQHVLGDAAPSELARAVERASFSAEELAADDGERGFELADDIASATRQRTSWWHRVLGVIGLSEVLARRPPRRRRRARAAQDAPDIEMLVSNRS